MMCWNKLIKLEMNEKWIFFISMNYELGFLSNAFLPNHTSQYLYEISSKLNVTRQDFLCEF